MADAPTDLQAILPALLPGAIAWAEAQSAVVAASGKPLIDQHVPLARSVGVVQPELVYVLVVASLLLPDDPALRAAALQARLLGPNTTGLTFGHSILIRSDSLTISTLSELRHVHQYEQYGSIAAFLSVYLRQVIELGYCHAPFEIDAKNHEVNNWP